MVVATLALGALLLGGCSQQKPVRRATPPPPEISQTSPGDQAGDGIRRVPAAPRRNHDANRGARPDSGSAVNPQDDLEETYANAKPIYVETGLASWYGELYNNRRGANGEVFDMNANTAAHRTLPLNSVARVTNVQSGQSVLVRITDRGPFVGNRILDLSKSAAQAIDLWRAGIGTVKLEVLQAPAPIATGGKWAVQVGAFQDPEDASILKSELLEKYPDLRVMQFSGPTGEWIRIRVQGDRRKLAQEIAGEMQLAAAGTFLVRLD